MKKIFDNHLTQTTKTVIWRWLWKQLNFDINYLSLLIYVVSRSMQITTLRRKRLLLCRLISLVKFFARLILHWGNLAKKLQFKPKMSRSYSLSHHFPQNVETYEPVYPRRSIPPATGRTLPAEEIGIANITRFKDRFSVKLDIHLFRWEMLDNSVITFCFI